MTTVHQFHPVLAPGDAMSNHVFALRERIRAWGHESHAYAVEAKADVAEVRSYRRLFREARPDDLLIVHFSMGHEVIDQLAKLPPRKVLVYHNITPPEFFGGINPHAAAHARLGLRQLARVAPAFELAIGVSEFNRKALAEAGYAQTAQVALLIDSRRFVLCLALGARRLRRPAARGDALSSPGRRVRRRGRGRDGERRGSPPAPARPRRGGGGGRAGGRAHGPA